MAGRSGRNAVTEPIKSPAIESEKPDAAFHRLRKNLGMSTATDKLEEQEHRRVYGLGSFGLELGIGMVDPVTGQCGLPSLASMEVAGRPGCYKTGFLDQLILSIQRDNSSNCCAVFYSEGYEYKRLKRLGIDTDRLAIYDYKQTDKLSGLAEQGLDFLCQYSELPEVKLVALDSVKSMTLREDAYVVNKKTEHERDFDENAPPALCARLMTEFIRKWKRKNKNSILFMINQISESIGPEYLTGAELRLRTYGGRFKEHEADVRCLLTSWKLSDETVHPLFSKDANNFKMGIGLEIQAKIFKSRFCEKANQQVISTKFFYGDQSFNRAEQALDYAEYIGRKDYDNSPVKKIPGARWQVLGESFHGRPAVLDWVIKTPEARLELEKFCIQNRELLWDSSLEVPINGQNTPKE